MGKKRGKKRILGYQGFVTRYKNRAGKEGNTFVDGTREKRKWEGLDGVLLLQSRACGKSVPDEQKEKSEKKRTKKKGEKKRRTAK